MLPVLNGGASAQGDRTSLF